MEDKYEYFRKLAMKNINQHIILEIGRKRLKGRIMRLKSSMKGEA